MSRATPQSSAPVKSAAAPRRRRPLAVAGVTLAVLFGGLATPTAATAAQNNSFAMNYANSSPTGQNKDQWENYTRTHTGTGDINFTWSSASTLNNARMDLRYTSNHRIFASKEVGRGYGTVRLAHNWGPTRFNVGIWAGTVPKGWFRGTLYY